MIDAEALALWALAVTHGVTKLRELARLTGLSVLACGRRACENVMCDRLILNGTAYICDSCWEELLLFKGSWQPGPPSARVRIESFMDTPPGTFGSQTADELALDFVRLTSG